MNFVRLYNQVESGVQIPVCSLIFVVFWIGIVVSSVTDCTSTGNELIFWRFVKTAKEK